MEQERSEGGFEMYYLTPEQVLEKYRREDKPLNRGTIDVLFTPLAGTSWDRRIHEWLENPENEPYPLSAGILSSIFLSKYDAVEYCYDRRILNEVALALQAFSLPEHIATPENVHTADVLETDELFFIESRNDDIYADVTCTTFAFLHAIDQWRFYKNGRSLLTISINTFSGGWSYFGKHDLLEILSEGIIESQRLADNQYKPIPYMHPDQQAYSRNWQDVYVHPYFSFDPTWRKST